MVSYLTAALSSVHGNLYNYVDHALASTLVKSM